MNKINIILFALIFSTNAWAEQDKREIILLDQVSRTFVKQEMQGNIKGIQQALAALSKDDFFGVAEALRPLGMQGMKNVPSSLRSSLPMGFKKLGMPLHMAFDQLANKAETGMKTTEFLADLSQLMNACVACHAAYQVKDK